VRALGLALAGGIAVVLATSVARAAAPAEPPTLSPDTKVDFAAQPPEGKLYDESAAGSALGEPPPMRPRRAGLVVESSLGVLGFGGRFRNVAPPAYWLHTQVGYELLDWLMVYAEGEIALTDTGESQDESHTKAFPIWGFGGGVRATVHATARVAFYAQGEVGALSAIVPHGLLTVLGFRNAESLNLSAGVRLGAEWYQMNRHMALLVAAGGRYASGFAKVVGPSDFPLMWDAALGLRYVF
jgi:hypothetical protein